jgi:hypothetical protein
MALDGFCNLKWHGLLWLYVGLVLLGISLFFCLGDWLYLYTQPLKFLN